MFIKPASALLAACAFALAGLAACVSQPGVKPVSSSPVDVDVDALQRHVHALAVTHHPRSVENPARLEAAGDYVLAQMRAAGAAPRIQDVEVDGTVYRNLIARFGPAAGPLLIIGAHYDSCGDTPGADDNASGVAALLELARLLSRTPPPQPVELVAYTLEEPPYFRTESMGSFRHARELAQQRREVRLMVSLEMIGYFRDEPGTQDYPVGALRMVYPGEGNFIAIVGAFGDVSNVRRVKALFMGASDLPVESINAPASVPGVDFSDHANYWRFGMPAMMITDTAFLRNPNYHQPTDTPDTLDFRRMAKVVRAVHAVAMHF